MSSASARADSRLRVVLFSGGRGSRVLSKQLINNPDIALTVAINGYDDGLSTGEVRRFLGDSLGPSDFRKNASRLASELRSCPATLVALLDLRLPTPCSTTEARAAFHLVGGDTAASASAFQVALRELVGPLDAESRSGVALRLARFEHELDSTGRPFSFSDCSLGNLVFAGSFLERGRDFNAAVADYGAMLGLSDGLIENVTDGTNAYLVAIDRDGRLLGSEADIVDATLRNHIDDIYLLDRPPHDLDGVLAAASAADKKRLLTTRAAKLTLNPRLADRLAEADLIIYSPGTQHSSLFPSYLTPGLGAAIARNLTALKLLITNIQEDAEIPDSSAVDIIEKAVYYLREKQAQRFPTPCLITHYLINNPSRAAQAGAYIPPGRLESLEDPRLIRIGHYEDGVTGCHDAARVLTPFIESALRRAEKPTLAVFLLDTRSLDKISQTICEMLRGGIQHLSVQLVVLYGSDKSFDQTFTDSLPFELLNVPAAPDRMAATFLDAVRDRGIDYVVLFESSGMYRGEDIATFAAALSRGRLDCVWGSRRLSVRDIQESYMLRYRKKLVLGTLSYVGSHVLSLVYLLLYGRYISDTLSGARAIRAAYLTGSGLDLDHRGLNQALLSLLLRDRAEIFEVPVQFLPISPEKVRRTTVSEGLRSLCTILWRRFRPFPASTRGA